MEKKISISTITTCIGVLKVRVEKMQESIDFYDNLADVPTWMFDAINDYESSIDELKNYIGL